MSQLLEKLKKDTELEKRKLLFDLLFEQDVDFENRIIRIEGAIEEGVVSWFDAAMTLLEKDSNKGITITVNTEGGSVSEANGIIGRITASKRQITTVGISKVMSAGIGIVACGDKRKAYPYTEFMHHECAFDSGYDKLREHRNYTKVVERGELMRYTLLEELTGTPTDFWASKAKEPDFYFTTETAIRLGVIDEVVG